METRMLLVLLVPLFGFWSQIAAMGQAVSRHLVYPEWGHTTRTQVVFGLGLPMSLRREAITLGAVIKYNQLLPTNLSVFHEAREARRADEARGGAARGGSRWVVYSAIETLISTSQLNVDGHKCLLRAICEAAAEPFDHQSGLIAEMLHILFTPSTSIEVAGSGPERAYASAERVGRAGRASCAPYARRCPFSLLSLVSALRSAEPFD